MVSPPIWRCRPAPGRAPWWPVSQLQSSFPPAPLSRCRGQIGRKTQSSERHPNHRTPSRAMRRTSSTWSDYSILIIWPLQKNIHFRRVPLCQESPCWAAVAVTWNHRCGFGKLTALWILHHLLLLPFCFHSTVQHPVGHPSSTCHTADSLLRAPPGCYKQNTLLLSYF